MRAPLAPLPSPGSRVTVALYREARSFLLDHDPDGPRMLQWASKEIAPPDTPEKMAAEIIWIILCAGRSAQAARTIERRVWDAINSGRPAVEGFGYRAKAAAIDEAWRDRDPLHRELMEVFRHNDPEALVDWCGARRFVGDDTKFQLAKNFGSDVCKPDIWLCRLAGFPDRPRRPLRVRFPACMALCRHISEATGDRIAVVDSLLWLACNKGVLSVSPEAGEVSFNPVAPNRRSIMGDAADS